MKHTKKEFIRARLREEPTVSGAVLSREVREEFGKGISVTHAKTLREALENGTYDRVYHEFYGDETDWEESEKAGRKAKLRGERRKRTSLKGRRGVDRNKIRLDEFENHLLVYRLSDGTLTSQAFKSRDRAERTIRQLIREGTPEAEICWYRKNLPTRKAA